MNSIISIHSLLDSKKKDSKLISEFVGKIEGRVDLNRIKAHLNKHEKLSNTILLNTDKSGFVRKPHKNSCLQINH
jgi:hypothetical protein